MRIELKVSGKRGRSFYRVYRGRAIGLVLRRGKLLAAVRRTEGDSSRGNCGQSAKW